MRILPNKNFNPQNDSSLWFSINFIVVNYNIFKYMWTRKLLFTMGTVEKSLRQKLAVTFTPTRLDIFN